MKQICSFVYKVIIQNYSWQHVHNLTSTVFKNTWTIWTWTVELHYYTTTTTVYFGKVLQQGITDSQEGQGCHFLQLRVTGSGDSNREGYIFLIWPLDEVVFPLSMKWTDWDAGLFNTFSWHTCIFHRGEYWSSFHMFETYFITKYFLLILIWPSCLCRDKLNSNTFLL